MPRLESKYFTDDDKDILDLMSRAWVINSAANQTYWNEGTIDTRFKAGDQYLYDEIFGQYPGHKKRMYSFNRIRKIINMVSGHQRRNRKSTSVLPQEGSDELAADQFSTLLNWGMQGTNGYHTLSEAFEGGLTTGLNMLSVWMDYGNDPINGDLRLDNLKYNQVMLDQYASKPDMSDSSFMWTRKFMMREQATVLLPERKKDILAITGGFRDNKFNWLPEQFSVENTDLVAYDEFWHKTFRPAKILVDIASGETMEWTGNKENLKEYLSQFPGVRVQEIQKETVELAIVINNRVFYNGPNPYGIDRYPFVPVFAYFESEAPLFEWKIQGVVRGLRDPQYLFNRLNINMLDIVESQINSGLKVMEGSLVDNNDAFLSGQGRALFLKKSAPLGMQSVEVIPPPGINPSVFEMARSLGNEMLEDSGINEELLAAADDSNSGLQTMLRQGAGLTTLQTLFDNLDRSQKIVGELMMEMIQVNWTAGKVQRILGEQPADQFFNKAFQQFDSVVTEGVLSETQRKAAFVTLFEMQKAGIAIPPELLIDKAPIPEKKELKEAMEQQAKAQAESQQQAQALQMKQAEAQIELAQARAAADIGLRNERDSRVLSNVGLAEERRAESVADLEKATLDKIRGAKELLGIDLSSLQQLIDIVSSIKEQEQVSVSREILPNERGRQDAI